VRKIVAPWNIARGRRDWPHRKAFRAHTPALWAPAKAEEGNGKTLLQASLLQANVSPGLDPKFLKAHRKVGLS